jgi:ubiquinone/menaquinone biosynthesis C-methylase UbiE
MILRRTYQDQTIHQKWHATYFDALAEQLDMRLTRLMLEGLPFESSVLDAGCGRGDHAIRITKLGYRVFVTDLSSEVVGRLRSLRPCHSALEELPFKSQSFDAIHCRGVLMHIPTWQIALAELCRVLKVGGRICIFENNHQSLEIRIIRFVRRLMRRKSTMQETVGGLEFWATVNSLPFLVRFTNIEELVRELTKNGIEVVTKFGSEFWDPHRFPVRLRPWIRRFNLVWFLVLRGWHRPCSGVGLVGRRLE